MYYYRHGEVIFASLLPDLPLEPAKRPSAGTPSLFLIDRDPIRSRSSFCVSDPRQLTAETEDVTWLDPSRMGVPVPSLPKRLQHTIDTSIFFIQISWTLCQIYLPILPSLSLIHI